MHFLSAENSHPLLYLASYLIIIHLRLFKETVSFLNDTVKPEKMAQAYSQLRIILSVQICYI